MSLCRQTYKSLVDVGSMRVGQGGGDAKIVLLNQRPQGVSVDGGKEDGRGLGQEPLVIAGVPVYASEMLEKPPTCVKASATNRALACQAVSGDTVQKPQKCRVTLAL